MKKYVIPKFLNAGDTVVFMHNKKIIKDICRNEESQEIIKPYIIKFECGGDVDVPANSVFELVVETKKKKRGI